MARWQGDTAPAAAAAPASAAADGAQMMAAVQMPAGVRAAPCAGGRAVTCPNPRHTAGGRAHCVAHGQQGALRVSQLQVGRDQGQQSRQCKPAAAHEVGSTFSGLNASKLLLGLAQAARGKNCAKQTAAAYRRSLCSHASGTHGRAPHAITDHVSHCSPCGGVMHVGDSQQA